MTGQARQVASSVRASMVPIGHAGTTAQESAMLDEQIAEWTDVVKQASFELIAVELARRQRQLGATLIVAEEEASIELDMAQMDLAALIEAERLIQTIAAQLDEPG